MKTRLTIALFALALNAWAQFGTVPFFFNQLNYGNPNTGDGSLIIIGTYDAYGQFQAEPIDARPYLGSYFLNPGLPEISGQSIATNTLADNTNSVLTASDITGATLYIGANVTSGIHDAGGGFISGENITWTNQSGRSSWYNLFSNSIAYASPISEQPLNDGTGRSYYAANFTATATTLFYIQQTLAGYTTNNWALGFDSNGSLGDLNLNFNGVPRVKCASDGTLYLNDTNGNNYAFGGAAGFAFGDGTGGSKASVSQAGIYFGSGSGLTNLNATNFTGTIPLAQLPAAVVTNAALNLGGTQVLLGTVSTVNGRIILNLTNNLASAFTNVTLYGVTTFGTNGYTIQSATTNETDLLMNGVVIAQNFGNALQPAVKYPNANVTIGAGTPIVLNTNGQIIAASFTGNGAGLTNLAGMTLGGWGATNSVLYQPSALNIFIGKGVSNGPSLGTAYNTVIGDNAWTKNNNGSSGANVIIGQSAAALVTGPIYQCVTIGNNTFNNQIGGGSYCSALGYNTLLNNNGAFYNTAIGYNSMATPTFGASGGWNIGIGISAGNSLGTTSSNNIVVANAGVPTDTNTIRIGNTSHVATYLAGNIFHPSATIFAKIAAAPAFAAIGSTNTLFEWSSNNVPPTMWLQYYDASTNLQTKAVF